MKNRWLINIILLVMVLSISLFLFLKPTKIKQTKQFSISTFNLSDFDSIKIDFPSRASVIFKKSTESWDMIEPVKGRADQFSVQKIISIVATSSSEKLPSNDLAKYGLDKPTMKLKLIHKGQEEEFIFGTYNSVTEDQYLLYKENVYLISGSYSEAAATQPIELIDKLPLTKSEEIKYFDFSRLEQWQSKRLKVTRNNNEWSANEGSQFKQNEMAEWFDMTWVKNPAKSVEKSSIDLRIPYKSFDIHTIDGKKITFLRLQESPETKLYRVDEGLLYNFGSDIGFTMMNPPIEHSKK
ncbi:MULTISPECIES: DUF4340 domain-containing protein [Candidatus Methylopumilus]|jgi:hypothetical protein|uniref:DUF4340 domain-containing protein n=1 Tax=Candidatus Methylopumilus TaxID=1679002 RepID=UPI001121D6EB|nr:DUF4340 domain-containing protein [Candidatus Methylopumilus planktonicus]QDD01956.1 DUF4340 domain-containing protein [Candidatus Methylopumilus planktonicus]QDD07220.1 DUF4340 domain-containing protein [Candidatus Methylopumilus planktonicus]QDD08549.1 DUF4340 domain-containing protein [Candidatus Methylopumilus planktonicus]QDD09872.1 DUF4340 domain-containing protein [Candidatus Methylopumilus planktonicus]